MSRFTRFLGRRFPSVPPAQQARLLAAMESRPLTPAPSMCGEAVLGAGQTPEGEGLVHQLDPRDLERTSPAPSGPPPCEVDLFWRPAPDVASEFTDAYLATRLDRWTQEAQP